jgi:hypothetical protein
LQVATQLIGIQPFHQEREQLIILLGTGICHPIYKIPQSKFFDPVI